MLESQIQPTPSAPSAARRLLPRVLLASASGLVAALLSGELLLRYAVNSDSKPARQMAQRLRLDWALADPSSDEDWWKLQARFQSKAKPVPPVPDAQLGWLSELVSPGEYRHADEQRLGSRRPLLLYGDSFAHGNNPAPERFQGVLQRQPLGADFGLLNYGCGGYGFDQSVMLLERSVERFLSQQPVVLLSLLVDDDLDRMVLGLRGWPKPVLEQTAAGWDFVPPPTTNTSEYLALRPLDISWYVGRYLAHAPGLLPQRWRQPFQSGPRVAEKQELARAALTRALERLEALGLPHALLLLYGESGLESPQALQWREAPLRELCQQHGTPLLSSRPFLEAYLGDQDARLPLVFGNSPELAGHYTLVGNVLAFEPVRQWLEEGISNPMDPTQVLAQLANGTHPALAAKSRPLSLGRRQLNVVEHSQSPCAVYVEAHEVAAEGSSREAALLLRPGEFGPTRVELVLDAKDLWLRASLSLLQRPEDLDRSRILTLDLELDGRQFQRWNLSADSATEIEVSLAGHRQLALTASGPAGSSGIWLALTSPQVD